MPLRIVGCDELIPRRVLLHGVSVVHNDVVKLRSGAVQREANPTEQKLSLNVDEGLSGTTASTTCYLPGRIPTSCGLQRGFAFGTRP